MSCIYQSCSTGSHRIERTASLQLATRVHDSARFATRAGEFRRLDFGSLFHLKPYFRLGPLTLLDCGRYKHRIQHERRQGIQL